MSVALVKEKIETFQNEQNLGLTEVVVIDFIGYNILPNNLLKLLNFLKQSEDLRFTILTDLFAADFPNKTQRFEVSYSLLSLKLNLRILLKLSCEEGVAVPSVNSIFRAADWYEREVHDMFGIKFENNSDMRRILTDYSFVGHPLKKDFPLTGFLQVKYNDQLKQVVYEPVNLDQEYRNFDFNSPWMGPKNMLPGDEKATISANDKIQPPIIK